MAPVTFRRCALVGAAVALAVLAVAAVAIGAWLNLLIGRAVEAMF
jgi:hypothetical protein